MPTAILTVGVPASGKSTWAREYSRLYGTAIVCRDDIRIMQGLKHGENEGLVTEIHQAMIEGLIATGKNFIVADTNINKTFRNRLIKFCHQRGCDVQLVVFDVKLDEAILRDSLRKESVGPDVIRKMHDSLSGQQIEPGQFIPYQRYAKYEHGTDENFRPDCVIFDIDGTLAKHWNRSPYDYSKVADDEPIKDVCDIASILSNIYPVIFVSGRDDSCRHDTLLWIEEYTGIEDANLLMRKTGDQRPDWIIKNEIYDEHIIPNYNITMVFDDRDQVVTHLRARGITVAQVALGRF